eukprot:EG_transcript_45305
MFVIRWACGCRVCVWVCALRGVIGRYFQFGDTHRVSTTLCIITSTRDSPSLASDASLVKIDSQSSKILESWKCLTYISIPQAHKLCNLALRLSMRHFNILLFK